MLAFEDILKLIEQYDVITIFRHIHPDCDALGSQFGLKQWITENYPEKKVYALGEEKCTQGRWPESDTADIGIINRSLAVVVDTANAARVDDQRFLQAAKVIRIDHHPFSDEFGDGWYVNDHAAAVCEILTGFFSSTDKTLSSETAEFLYKGLLTDTLSFRTSNTTADTLRAAARLAELNLRIPEINRELFDHSLKYFRFGSFVRSKTEIINKHLASATITLEDLEEWQTTSTFAKNFIDELGHVRDFEIWTIFAARQTDHGTVYDGSIRSKTIPINGIAARFNGGGHKNASGVKDLTDAQRLELLEVLSQKLSSLEE